MAVSSHPSSVWIATLHWIVSRLFKPVLGSMLDFADEEKMEDSMWADGGLDYVRQWTFIRSLYIFLCDFPSLVILFQVSYYLISMQCHTFLNGQIGIGAGVESFQETYECVSCDQIWKVHHWFWLVLTFSLNCFPWHLHQLTTIPHNTASCHISRSDMPIMSTSGPLCR